ncbi:MAG TPA: response regulator transcription factor [Thermoanaerobaculia bacterium]|nr:response regulator transcription factor [Thermoanaerobaculia bacterium]
MKRVLVVEDNRDLAYGLRNNLEIEGYAVDVASHGAVGLDRAINTRPDLVVLDLMLPGMDGFRILRAIREADLTMPVLVLTARGEESDKVRCLKLGADDYLTKPFGVLELLARVEALLRRANGKTIVTAARERFGDIELDRASHAVTLDGAPVELAPKEYDLLVALADRRGAVVTRLELMRQVWGYSDAVITRTIDTHIGELRRKLERDPAHPRHILTVRKVGYRLEPR